MPRSFDFGAYLTAHHIRPSYPRIRIFQYIAEERTHPTADEIYSALSPQMSTLSRTTVYNTLDLFVRENIVQPLAIEGNQKRYDADMTPHGHFRCRQCGRIFDFAVETLRISGLEGFEVLSGNIYYYGFCPACRKLRQGNRPQQSTGDDQ